MGESLSRRGFLRLNFGDPSAPPDRWIRVHRTAMACRFEVTLHPDDADAVGAAREALDEADRVESLLSVFRPDTPVSRVNRDASTGAVEVDPELFALVERCRALHAATEGAFDITSTPLSRCWGFLQRQGRVPDDPALEAARGLTGFAQVELERRTRTVKFARAGVELNFGAIGKGYALDRMGDILRQRGVRHALISAGSSSVLAVGGRGTGWPIDIRSPQAARTQLGRVHLKHGALGTSGAGEQFFVANGARYGHVIDPRTGWPAQGVISASVLAASAADADALSTACLIGGAALAEHCAALHPALLVLLTLPDPERAWRAGHYPGAFLQT